MSEGGSKKARQPGSSASLEGPDFIMLDLHGFWEDDDLTKGYRLLYHAAYRELATAVTGKEPEETPPPENEFKESVLAFLEKERDKYHEKICVEFDYCRKRKDWKDSESFLLILIGLIGIFADIASGTGVASGAWLLSAGTLDKFCKCSEKQDVDN